MHLSPTCQSLIKRKELAMKELLEEVYRGELSSSQSLHFICKRANGYSSSSSSRPTSSGMFDLTSLDDIT